MSGIDRGNDLLMDSIPLAVPVDEPKKTRECGPMEFLEPSRAWAKVFLGNWVFSHSIGEAMA